MKKVNMIAILAKLQRYCPAAVFEALAEMIPHQYQVRQFLNDPAIDEHDLFELDAGAETAVRLCFQRLEVVALFIENTSIALDSSVENHLAFLDKLVNQ